jgi:hypothetical protein
MLSVPQDLLSVTSTSAETATAATENSIYTIERDKKTSTPELTISQHRLYQLYRQLGSEQVET